MGIAARSSVAELSRAPSCAMKRVGRGPGAGPRCARRRIVEARPWPPSAPWCARGRPRAWRDMTTVEPDEARVGEPSRWRLASSGTTCAALAGSPHPSRRRSSPGAFAGVSSALLKLQPPRRPPRPAAPGAAGEVRHGCGSRPDSTTRSALADRRTSSPRPWTSPAAFIITSVDRLSASGLPCSSYSLPLDHRRRAAPAAPQALGGRRRARAACPPRRASRSAARPAACAVRHAGDRVNDRRNPRSALANLIMCISRPLPLSLDGKGYETLALNAWAKLGEMIPSAVTGAAQSPSSSSWAFALRSCPRRRLLSTSFPRRAIGCSSMGGGSVDRCRGLDEQGVLGIGQPLSKSAMGGDVDAPAHLRRCSRRCRLPTAARRRPCRDRPCRIVERAPRSRQAMILQRR